MLNEELESILEKQEVVTEVSEVPDETLDGCNILVSGDFKSMSRKEFEDLIMYKGAYQPCFIN